MKGKRLNLTLTDLSMHLRMHLIFSLVFGVILYLRGVSQPLLGAAWYMLLGTLMLPLAEHRHQKSHGSIWADEDGLYLLEDGETQTISWDSVTRAREMDTHIWALDIAMGRREIKGLLVRYNWRTKRLLDAKLQGKRDDE